MSETSDKIIIGGAVGSGKSTLARRLAEALGARGIAVGGFVTAELRERADGPRLGFRLEPLGDGGTPRVVAHRDFVSRHRVGRYGVDAEVVNYVVDTALSARALAGREVVIVDEVGKMQMTGSRFARAIDRLVGGAPETMRALVLTVGAAVALPDALAELEAAARFEVTPSNRDALLQQLVTRLAPER